jgi:hypothetical protein
MPYNNITNNAPDIVFSSNQYPQANNIPNNLESLPSFLNQANQVSDDLLIKFGSSQDNKKDSEQKNFDKDDKNHQKEQKQNKIDRQENQIQNDSDPAKIIKSISSKKLKDYHKERFPLEELILLLSSGRFGFSGMICASTILIIAGEINKDCGLKYLLLQGDNEKRNLNEMLEKLNHNIAIINKDFSDKMQSIGIKKELPNNFEDLCRNGDYQSLSKAFANKINNKSYRQAS